MRPDDRASGAMGSAGRPRTIAIDGPVASGKSSVGQGLAARLGYLVLDTGLLYRAAARLAIDAAIPLEDGARVAALVREAGIEVRQSAAGDGPIVLAGGCDVAPRLGTSEVDAGASIVSARSTRARVPGRMHGHHPHAERRFDGTRYAEERANAEKAVQNEVVDENRAHDDENERFHSAPSFGNMRRLAAAAATIQPARAEKIRHNVLYSTREINMKSGARGSLRRARLFFVEIISLWCIHIV